MHNLQLREPFLGSESRCATKVEFCHVHHVDAHSLKKIYKVRFFQIYWYTGRVLLALFVDKVC